MKKDGAFYSKIGKRGIKLRWKKIHSKIILPRSMTKEKASLHAYLCGDGHVGIRKDCNGGTHYEISFFPDDKLMLSNICNCLLKYSGITPREIKEEGIMYRVRFNNKILCKDLLSIGRSGTYNWNIPSIIRKKFARVWISCFFDCEAHVNEKERCIQIKSVNSNGLGTVKRMLKELGINAKFYGPYRQRISGSDYFVLSMGRRGDLLRYAKKIGFNHSEKHKKLLSILNLRPDGPMVRRK